MKYSKGALMKNVTAPNGMDALKGLLQTQLTDKGGIASIFDIGPSDLKHTLIMGSTSEKRNNDNPYS